MSRFFRTLSVIALTSTPGLVLAQQPAQPIAAQPGQIQPGQPGQIQPGQAGQNQPGRPGQAGQLGHPAMHAQGVSLNAFIAHKLKRGNEAEVELGQLAVDHAKDDSVKEFAQMMVKSHQQMIQKLAQFDTGTGASSRDGAGREAQNREGSERDNPNRNDQNRNDQNRNDQNRDQSRNDQNRDNASNATSDGARSNVRNSESNTDGEAGREQQRSSSGTSQASSGAGAVQGTTAAGQAGQAGRAQVAGQNQPGGQVNQLGHAQGQMGGMSGHVPHMLVALSDQTCDNELQLTKKMLQKHDGGDFDMAYIGQQIVAHTCMLAHLQALKSSGPQELQQLASQGEQETQKHLDQAMKIAEDLGGKKK